MPPSSSRLRRAVRRGFATFACVIALGAIVFLPFAGRFLLYEDPLRHADAIFVLAGARAERWMEAVDLYHEGIAPRIVLSPGRLEDAELVLRDRGVRFPMDAELARDAILQMHVPATAVSVLGGSMDNTAQEAAAVHQLARAQGWHTIVVVTSKYHTHRAAFAFQREFDDTHVDIIMRASRYDTSDPAHWWRHRADIRFVSSELEKLVFYRMGLGQ